MRLLCPHCQNSMELASIPSEGVVCASCGSSICLEGGSTTGWNPSDSQRKLGKFELLDQVGVGAFGTVYKARDTDLDRIVAIKVPRAGNLGGSSGDTDRFLREARSVAQLRHPAIVPVYEVGQHDSVPYLVSEFVQGVTLADRLTDERLPFRDAAELVAALADALQYAHEHGVVHRDVKPSNIMIESAERGVRNAELKSKDSSLRAPSSALRVRLMDFGLAKRDTGGEAAMTVEGQVLGTPAYMSPEQARGASRSVDSRSDVYSLGVILYQLLTGVLPFRGNAQMLLHHVLHDDPKPPRKRDAAIPRDLETICQKAMAKETGRRYQTAAEFAADLRRFLAGEPIQARPVSVVERAVKWVRRRPYQAALIGLLVVFVGSGLGVGGWLWQREAENRRQQEARTRAAEEAKQVKIEYYANVIKRWGVPEGISPVTPEQARRRFSTFRFTRRGGVVEKVEAVNGHGFPTTWHNMYAYLLEAPDDSGVGRRRECTWEYQRDAKGDLVDEIARNRGGAIVWTFHYTTRTTGHYRDERGFPRPRTASGATFVEFGWSEDGLEKERRFLDRNGKPRPDTWGAFGVLMDYDANGLVVAETYLGPQGQPVMLPGGYAKYTFKHDERGNLVEATSLDLNGRPVTTRNGVAGHRRVYDAHGNWTESHYLGVDGKPALHWRGSARLTYASDEHGNVTEIRHFGVNGERVLERGHFLHRIGHDSSGNVISRAAFDKDENATGFEGGSHRRTYTPSQSAFRREEADFDANGRPATFPGTDAHKVRITADDRGYTTETAYFDETGKPTLDRYGVHKYQNTYDERGYRTEIQHFGRAGEPVLHNQAGAAKITRTYDDYGNVEEEAFFGTDNQLCSGRDGAAKTTFKYDDFGNRTEQFRFGVDGKLTSEGVGYARVIWKFDPATNVHTESVYRDENDKPVQTQVVVKEVRRPSLQRPTTAPWEEGDVLLTYEGKPVHCAILFLNLKALESSAEKPKQLVVLRKGVEVTLDIPAGAIRSESELETRGAGK